MDEIFGYASLYTDADPGELLCSVRECNFGLFLVVYIHTSSTAGSLNDQNFFRPKICQNAAVKFLRTL